MKLFIREHVPLTIMFVMQLLVTISVCLLAEVQDPAAVLYIIVLNTAFFAAYLTYRYVRHAWLYRRLSEPIEELDDSVIGQEHTPLGEALGGLLRKQYGLYQQQINRYRKTLDDHITFIHQWVHQMKTPLSVIHLTIQDEHDPLFDSLKEETDKMKKGLETVLYASRLDAFEQDFIAAPVQLRALVGKVIADHKNSFVRSRVFPEMKVDEGLMVMSDDKWLAFVISQLITNAVRYSAGKSSRITISAAVRGHRTFLEVRDYGIGIPPQDMKRVFEPYFTGENGRRYGESTGMGLYLVREICTRLDHRVEIESEPGEGTAVRIGIRTAKGG